MKNKQNFKEFMKQELKNSPKLKAILNIACAMVIAGVLGIIVFSTFLQLQASAAELTMRYEPMGVPNINSSFKSYEDYGCITSQESPQYKFLHDWCWVDYEGFVRCDGETEFGITDSYYCVAMGSYYGTEIGSKYKVTTDTGNVIYCALVDQKANCNTNSTHQYGTDNYDVLEFIVNTYPYTEEPDRKYKQFLWGSPYYLLNSEVQLYGSANVYSPLNGNIVSIEKIIFEWIGDE